ncbi:MAG: PAS domain-containing protein [Epsilonproteobacteria bacterium]|nr:PAS domain-containing protein [Campylobacterota bacterium]
MEDFNSNRIHLDQNDLLVSKTDLKGKITYCNKIFMKVAGYQEDELLGKPHNIVRHKDMPKIVFKLLWDRVKSGNEIFAFVKNRTKNGGYYWVYANVTPSIDDRGNIVGYYSVRRKVNEENLNLIEELYSSLIKKEKEGGMESSMQYLNNLLKTKGVTYDEFIASVQG